MNSEVVLNVLILLAMNCCCANGGIVSIVRSSTSTISNWYDYYIKPLWTPFTTHHLGVSPDADITFYEHDGIGDSPPIQDENDVLMDWNEDQVLFSPIFRHLMKKIIILNSGLKR